MDILQNILFKKEIVHAKIYSSEKIFLHIYRQHYLN